MRARAITTIAIGLAVAACGSDTGTPSDTQDATGDVAKDTITPPPSPWTVTLIASGRTGRQIQAAVLPDGTPVAAAYVDEGTQAELCDPASETAGNKVTWTLQYAQPDGAGVGAAWTVEKVGDIFHLGAPRGFDLDVAPDGTPTIAALTGDVSVMPPYCGANDLGLYRRAGNGTWTPTVAVADSNEAMTGEPASDFGNVVGLWPALAFDPNGNAFVAYRDVHGGGLQGDDFTRADLEAAWQQGGGGFAHDPIDWGKGMGEFNAAAFDAEGRPLVLAFNPRDDLVQSNRGLWLFRGTADGATWEKVALFRGGIAERPSIAVDHTGGDGDGTIWVAWYDGEVGLPYVAHLSDPERFDDVDGGWVIEDIGDHVFDEGRHPSIAVSPEGIIGVAYQRCGRASDGIGDCNPSRDAVIFAWADGPTWEREIVEDEPDGLCGNFTSLVWAKDSATVFYQCLVASGDDFADEWRAARRKDL